VRAIDIRDPESEDPIGKIVFADCNDSLVTRATHLTYCDSGRIKINDATSYIYLTEKDQAEDMIKALQEAIRLGWFEE
jgi:hypothetical protein